MYVAVAVGNIQWKIRFTVTKDELRCSTWQKVECWYPRQIVLKMV